MGSVQWPCNEKAPEGTPVMHMNGFVRGKGKFIITQYVPTDEKVTRMYPLILTTGRILSQYNVGAQSRRTANVRWHDEDLLESHPWEGNVDREVLARCIAACFECAQACTSCADACLSEDDVADMRKCIRIDLDCADICVATGNTLSRHTGYDANLTRAILEACATACKTCGDECESHAEMHEHCRICAEACRRCERACGELISSLT